MILCDSVVSKVEYGVCVCVEPLCVIVSDSVCEDAVCRDPGDSLVMTVIDIGSVVPLVSADIGECVVTCAPEDEVVVCVVYGGGASWSSCSVSVDKSC